MHGKAVKVLARAPGRQPQLRLTPADCKCAPWEAAGTRLWPRPGCCEHLGREPADRRFDSLIHSLSLPTPLLLCLSNKYIFLKRETGLPVLFFK